jgi:hypothetical protein
VELKVLGWRTRRGNKFRVMSQHQQIARAPNCQVMLRGGGCMFWLMPLGAQTNINKKGRRK